MNIYRNVFYDVWNWFFIFSTIHGGTGGDICASLASTVITSYYYYSSAIRPGFCPTPFFDTVHRNLMKLHRMLDTNA